MFTCRPVRGARLPLAACAADARATCYKRQPGLRGVAGRKVVNSDHTQDTHVILVLNTGQRTYFGISCVSCVVPQRGQSPWPGRAQSTQSQSVRETDAAGCRRPVSTSAQEHTRQHVVSQRRRTTQRLAQRPAHERRPNAQRSACVSCVSPPPHVQETVARRGERDRPGPRDFSHR